VRTYISQHMAQARWWGSRSLGAICAGVFCFFFAEVQKYLVVGEQGGLWVFDLNISAKMLIEKMLVEKMTIMVGMTLENLYDGG
jgi:hypothetical protein